MSEDELFLGLLHSLNHQQRACVLVTMQLLSTPQDHPEWLTVEQAMKRTGYSRSAIERAMREGHLKSHKQPGLSTWRIRSDELEEWMNGN